MKKIKTVALEQMKFEPSMTITSKEMPQIKDWKVGETYKIKADMEIMQEDAHVMGDGIRAHFVIKNISVK